MSWNPNGGSYSHERVLRIERLITHAMVERALRRRGSAAYVNNVSPLTWIVRRNLALGVSCGAVKLEELRGDDTGRDKR